MKKTLVLIFFSCQLLGYGQSLYPDSSIINQASILTYVNSAKDTCNIQKDTVIYNGSIGNINNFISSIQSPDSIKYIQINGLHTLPDLYTINIPTNIHITGDAIIKPQGTAYDVIRISNSTCAGLHGITIDTRSQYPSSYQDSWKRHDHFKNKSIIRIQNSSYIQVDSVTLERIYGDGVMMSNSSNCRIISNEIKDAWTHGGKSGTQGYGIDVVGGQCRNNLIEENTITSTRHGIVIQDDANWNIAGYNVVHDSYALKKFFWLVFKDRTYTFDITIHGDGAHHNLIEGNQTEHRIYIDDEHATNGPGNILYRNITNNRIQIDGNNNGYNYGQIMIANEAPTVRCRALGSKVYNNTEYGFMPNYIPVKNTQVDDSLLGVTCYREKKKVVTMSINKMEIDNALLKVEGKKHRHVYPNPIQNGSTLNLGDTFERVTLYDLNGREIYTEENTDQLELRDLMNGIYILNQFYTENGRVQSHSQKVVIY